MIQTLVTFGVTLIITLCFGAVVAAAWMLNKHGIKFSNFRDASNFQDVTQVSINNSGPLDTTLKIIYRIRCHLAEPNPCISNALIM